MFHCQLLPHWPNIPNVNNVPGSDKTLQSLLHSWSQGHFRFAPVVYDRHERRVQRVHANQATAWQQAVTEAAVQYSLPNLFCTQDTALHIPMLAKPFAIVQEIQMSSEELANIYNTDGQTKTSRLFFRGITQRLNTIFDYLVQQVATPCTVSGPNVADAVSTLFADLRQPAVLLGNPTSLLSLGVSTRFNVRDYVAPGTGDDASCRYYLGALAKYPISVVCAGRNSLKKSTSSASGFLDSFDAFDALFDMPDDTAYLLPACLGHFSCSDIAYASSYLNPSSTVESDGCAWMHCDISENKLWLSASQEFSLELYEGRGCRQIKIVD